MSLLITDKINNRKKDVLFWSRKVSKIEDISILNIIEKNKDKYRSRFCKIINDLPQDIYSEKKLFKKLNITKDFSPFWSSDIYEKSFYKNPNIINIIKLVALDDFLVENKIKEIKLEIDNYDDVHSISNICKVRKINLIKKEFFKKKIIFFFKELNKFNLILIFFKFLKFILVRLSFSKINWEELNIQNVKNIFFSYSIYSDQNKIKNGEYNSKYWDPLLDKTDIKEKSFFFNIFFQKDKNILINELFNLSKIKNKKKVFFVEQVFSFEIFIKIILIWFTSIFKIISLRYHFDKNLRKKNITYLKTYLERDYFSSFIGLSSLTNYYYFFIFQKIALNLNKIKKIFYLYENQGWEKMMNYHFKSKSKTFAVNHASIRYWDLRFSYNLSEPEIFKPNFYLVNGEDSFKKFLKFGYPQNNLKKVEALRYYELLMCISKTSFDDKLTKNILVVSDALDISNQSIANCINFLDDEITENFKFSLKEHPIKKFNQKTKIDLVKVNQDLFNLKKRHDIAIVTNTTSAIIDLYLLGYKVICPVDNDIFNLSPLAYSSDVDFVYDFSKINQTILELNKNNNNISIDKKKNFFYFQKDLDFWKSVIRYD